MGKSHSHRNSHNRKSPDNQKPSSASETSSTESESYQHPISPSSPRPAKPTLTTNPHVMKIGQQLHLYSTLHKIRKQEYIDALAKFRAWYPPHKKLVSDPDLHNEWANSSNRNRAFAQLIRGMEDAETRAIAYNEALADAERSTVGRGSTRSRFESLARSDAGGSIQSHGMRALTKRDKRFRRTRPQPVEDRNPTTPTPLRSGDRYTALDDDDDYDDKPRQANRKQHVSKKQAGSGKTGRAIYRNPMSSQSSEQSSDTARYQGPSRSSSRNHNSKTIPTSVPTSPLDASPQTDTGLPSSSSAPVSTPAATSAPDSDLAGVPPGPIAYALDKLFNLSRATTRPVPPPTRSMKFEVRGQEYSYTGPVIRMETNGSGRNTDDGLSGMGMANMMMGVVGMNMPGMGPQQMPGVGFGISNHRQEGVGQVTQQPQGRRRLVELKNGRAKKRTLTDTESDSDERQQKKKKGRRSEK
ncbi:hypothetical protein P153DRAFT_391417 [Dothidotthia symphoricarpi CBS 119687]|uniref:Uncharacterized protein n=1 Tax=Dothidotthia symphoricarpi CBS 119687 TaxID=1392245 RepID=A0A6A5ZVB4_9PLEO|nr:uncharacterized protein P153DRAFT_391417 [Dothidotthia symphoricarpi CBS 119687]KAF2123580.1 hypothetical protein P153DRAFT_391417 [Dothidotthia symphoricarpi CBS 119687]